MRIMRFSLLPGFAVLVALSACSSNPNELIDMQGQYWQRASVSSATYLRGPKAQQMLNRDISRCVVALRELERLGTLKDAIPAGGSGAIPDPDQVKTDLDDWDTPERNEHLFAEHTDYHDFDSCMDASGWERIKYVPFDVAEQSRENYLKSHVRYDYPPRAEQNPDFDHLND